MAEELLRLLVNRTNQSILGLLAVEPTYPRRVAELLGFSETEVARRLKKLERLGVVAGGWQHVGKNVRVYRLALEGLTLRVTPAGVQLELIQPGGARKELPTLAPAEATAPAAGSFYGRQDELDRIGRSPVAIVEGLAGIGKTSLVARYVEERADCANVFWHAFRGIESINWLANRAALFLARRNESALLHAIEQGADAADRRELLLKALNDARFLWVFDDAHRVEDPAVQQLIRDAVEGTTAGKLILATRQRIPFNPTLKHVGHLRLEGLDDAAVVAMLNERSLQVPAALLPRIRDEVGGHPLALTLLCEVAREQGSLEALLDRIPERDLEEYLLQEIYQGLGDEERRALALASVFRTSFTLQALRALTERDPERVLLKLRQRGLLEVRDSEYRLHEVVRNFAHNLLQDKPTFHARAARHHLSLGTLEGRLEAMHHLLTAGHQAEVLTLLERDLDLEEFHFIDAGYHNLYLAVLEQLDDSKVTGTRSRALLEDEKGDIRFHRNESERALQHYERAAKLFGELKDKKRLADLGWKRALVLQRLGRVKDALAACQEGLEHAPDKGIERQRLEAALATLQESPKKR